MTKDTGKELTHGQMVRNMKVSSKTTISTAKELRHCQTATNMKDSGKTMSRSGNTCGRTKTEPRSSDRKRMGNGSTPSELKE